jgi:hypothetical protein
MGRASVGTVLGLSCPDCATELEFEDLCLSILRFLPPNGCHTRLDIDSGHNVLHRLIIPFPRVDLSRHWLKGAI